MRIARNALAVLSIVASAGVGLLAGAVTSAPAASTGSTWSVSHSAFEPCPCINPVCRPGCYAD
jgi:hypothetical protein